MGIALVVVRSHALDFPDICLNFSWEILVRRKNNFLHTTLHIFTRIYLPVKMASKTVITVMIRFSALLPISAPFECNFVNKRPHSAKRHYSNIILEYGFVSTGVHLF